MDSVKVKVSLGYLTLVILTSLIIWVSYSEIRQYSGEEVDFNPANNKFIYINTILTNLYQAEGLERSYAQSGQKIQFRDYLKLMDTITMQIDTLALMVDSPIQQMHTDSIKKLLQVKQQNLKELSAIKKKNSPTVRYQQALKKLTKARDSIDNNIKVYKNITTNRDSVYVKQKKKNFFERLANVFTAQNKADSNLHVLTTQSVQVDSLLNPVGSVDTIAGFISAVITEIKDDSVAIEARVKLKEQEVLANDRTITMQLRQMLTNIENEELINSFQKVQSQQSRIEKKTALIIFVGGFALLTIIFFLVNILKDITRSQHYRKNLEEAKAFSELLLKSKEQFMLSLTHDLKSPLSSIIGFTAIMQDDVAVLPQHLQYLQNIQKSSGHILNLINSLLDLARLETGKLTIDHIPFNLNPLIADIVEGFRPQAMEKNIELLLQSNIQQSAVYISDPLRITQIVSNLISNAIKFTEEGKVTITVSVFGASENIEQIQIEVVDTGIGISEGNAKRIFEEFARVASAEKQYEGTGLGLTITQKLILLLQGTIRLESKPGDGSRFTIVLPLEKGEQLAGSSLEISAEPKQASKIEIAGRRVWLIDDDETVLEMTSAILTSAGMEVHPFSDPEKAIDSFEKGCASLLITDIQMPGMNGDEVLKQIQEKNGGQITAIAISGRNLQENEFSGFAAFIQKPFQPHTLIETITGHMTKLEASDYQGSSVVSRQNGYNLKQLAAFAEGDPELLRQILVSFISTGKQNVTLFRQFLLDENYNSLSELSHKMLPMFRQLEAYEIAELLSRMEQRDFVRKNRIHYYLEGTLVLERIESLLITLHKVEIIHAD